MRQHLWIPNIEFNRFIDMISQLGLNMLDYEYNKGIQLNSCYYFKFNKDITDDTKIMIKLKFGMLDSH